MFTYDTIQLMEFKTVVKYSRTVVTQLRTSRSFINTFLYIPKRSASLYYQKRFTSTKNSDTNIKNIPQFPNLNAKLLSLQPIKPNDKYISCTVFNKVGTVTAVSKRFQKWEFLRQHELFPRDLRKIDTSSVDVIPTILVKSNCIVLNMLHIKALIQKDNVFVFDTINTAVATKLGVLMYDLESRLSNVVPSSTPRQLYEHKALESMLINVMSSLETEFKTHSHICRFILNELENEVNRDKLRELLIKSKNLTSFYQKSILIRDVLDELLESDDDLASMYLSVRMTEDDDFSDIEMLLENYYTQCDEFVQQAESLIQDIKSTEEIVNIILDANRNSLMLLELKVTIYTLGITVATLLPAFYGMNLKNFIEESILGFGGVVIFSMLAAVLITKANFRALRTVTKLSMFTSSKVDLKTKITKEREMNLNKYAGYAENDSAILDTPWYKLKNWLKSTWTGRSAARRNLGTKEERDIIWRWLIEDKKD